MHGRSAKRILAACIWIGAALILTACATATPYKPAGKSGYGYRQEQLENNRYRVSFIGNDHTPIDTVQNYLLYRAAQITLSSGNDYFIITHQGTQRMGGGNNSSFGVGTGGGFSVGGGGFGIGIGTLLGGGSSESFMAYATIVVGKGPTPADQPQAYNARELKKRLQPKIKKPDDTSKPAS